MKGIIIAGGLGTRLRPITYYRPKPLVPVVNRPFLEYQVALLREHGIDDIVFATNFMADMIESHFGNGTGFGVRMRYAIEDQPLGTGGAIRNAANLFPGESVAVFNGDVLTDFDLTHILEFHANRGAIATITLAEVPSPNPFGVLILADDGRVKEWREPSEEAKKALAANPGLPRTGTDLINAGFYVLAPEFLERIPDGVRSSVERDIYPALLAEGAPVYGIAPGGFWMDVGRAEQLLLAVRAVLGGGVRSSLETERVGAGSTIDGSAKLDPHTSVGRGCCVGPNVKLNGCILMDGVKIGAGSKLSGVVLDEGVTIEEEVEIGSACPTDAATVVAAGSVIRKGSRL
jgi:NDP-sugar pyrophosphorylase family protein